ncbi:ArsC family reductase [uncultured Piscinibacter sp.]|uniref:ArsC family reductase n=1 Tax=uncultured Piscinibacter sp. TaxID=1131835 RepID=UPI00262DF92F|nr:ArsC family reductase [uncultured Piscinibacter sp.]
MNTVLYGIPNCDTVKKARAWLAGQGVDAVFHDYRKQGVPRAELEAWIGALGWEKLLNRQGTTWRKLDPARQAAVTDARSALALMIEQPSVIRRPVLVRGDTLRVGFDATDWSQLFG